MASSTKPITLYSHPSGPNPWKVVMILETLNLPYTTVVVPRDELKKQAYESICINGRAPAIEDPNTGFTLWESCAIIEYLVETYDKAHTISFDHGTTEFFHARQWLYFQASGQGPYFGQAVWFKLFHPEKVQSAQDRYVNEIHRVSGVLNRALAGKEWLVGEKFSFVDHAFVPWYEAVTARVIGDAFSIEHEFPNLHGWLARAKAQPGVAKALKAKADAAARK